MPELPQFTSHQTSPNSTLIQQTPININSASKTSKSQNLCEHKHTQSTTNTSLPVPQHPNALHSDPQILSLSTSLTLTLTLKSCLRYTPALVGRLNSPRWISRSLKEKKRKPTQISTSNTHKLPKLPLVVLWKPPCSSSSSSSSSWFRKWHIHNPKRWIFKLPGGWMAHWSGFRSAHKMLDSKRLCLWPVHHPPWQENFHRVTARPAPRFPFPCTVGTQRPPQSTAPGTQFLSSSRSFPWIRTRRSHIPP